MESIYFALYNYSFRCYFYKFKIDYDNSTQANKNQKLAFTAQIILQKHFRLIFCLSTRFKHKHAISKRGMNII